MEIIQVVTFILGWRFMHQVDPGIFFMFFKWSTGRFLYHPNLGLQQRR